MIDTANIPKSPGCYLFKDMNGTILYVGKAKNLFKRVNSYFQKKDHIKRTTILVSKIDLIDFIVTDTEREALILENNLIKKYNPRYNIDLKDSKRYAYLKLTAERFPRLVLARHIIKEKGSDRAKYFGPFVSGAVRDEIKKLLIKIFKIRTCRKFPKRECLRYHIEQCTAPCTGRITEEEYMQDVNSVAMILNGKTEQLSKELKKRMKDASNSAEYELALNIKNQLVAIKWLKEKQKVQRQKKYNEDIINFRIKDNKVYLLLFNIKKGILENKQSFIFDDTEGFFEEFLLQYYINKSKNNRPKELIIPTDISQTLKELIGVKVTVPKIGEKLKLLKLANKNIELSFFANIAALDDLQDKLKLPNSPNTIECFDISHISGSSTVGSMVQFKNGIPFKNNYRRFKIKTVEGVDDFKAIAEVVRRRYSRLQKEEQEMPDLIIIDGGKGQLSAAVAELQLLGLRLPIISIAKKHEEIFVPGLRIPLNIDKKSKALNLIRMTRDEAHRFAINYNRLLRTKSTLEKK